MSHSFEGRIESASGAHKKRYGFYKETVARNAQVARRAASTGATFHARFQNTPMFDPFPYPRGDGETYLAPKFIMVGVSVLSDYDWVPGSGAFQLIGAYRDRTV